MERRHGREPTRRQGARKPGPWLGTQTDDHPPAPVDMSEESVAGEEDPGAGLDTALAAGATHADGTDPASGLPEDGSLPAGAAGADDDELRGFEPLDRGRIHLLDPLEVKYWCRELNCSAPELKDTVSKVGTHVAAVREALHKA